MVLCDTSKGDIGWKRYLLAGWAFVECLLFGGLLHGWGSLVFVLKDEHIYAGLCPEIETNLSETNLSLAYDQKSAFNQIDLFNISTTPPVKLLNSNDSMIEDVTGEEKMKNRCVLQDKKMALCFTIASALYSAGCAVMGHINYKFVTRVTRIVSFLCFISRSLMLASASVDLPWLIYPGLSMVGIGGLPLLVTNTQVANLFSKGSARVIALLNGAFDTSSAVQLIVKLAHQGGFSRQKLYYVITALHSMTLVSTFGYLPKKFIPRLEPVKIVREVYDSRENALEVVNGEENKGLPYHRDVEQVKSNIPSLQKCVKQPVFITHCMWLSLLQLRFFYFIGSLNTYLNRILDRDEALVSYFTDVCLYTMMGGVFSSFISGMIYDWQKKVCQKDQSRMYREMMPAVLPLSMTCLLSLVLSILVLIPVRELMFFSLIILTVFRSFLYSVLYIFITAVDGNHRFYRFHIWKMKSLPDCMDVLIQSYDYKSNKTGLTNLDMRFPTEYNGMLYGIAAIVGGLFSFLQFAFFSWSEVYPDAHLHADMCLLMLAFCSFVHALYIWLKCWREERKFSIK